MNIPVIELAGISIAFPGRGKVLSDLDFSLYAGEKVGIKGTNGSGKTTLLHVMMGLIKPDAGVIKIFGRERKEEKDFREVRRHIGLLFQDSDDQLFSPTVEEDIAFGPLNLRKSREEVRRIVEEMCTLLGIENLRDRFSHTLSHGEKRLVALATILAMEPRVLLLDEPTTALDEKTTRRIEELLVSQKQLTYCIVSHDMNFLGKVSEKLYILEKGRLEG
ncbi:MAG: ABC transporter ATP-binding protein [Caldiserica bacterium]|nr:ABC transporter ATP-binding protein [Caldisericota bacterium]